MVGRVTVHLLVPNMGIDEHDKYCNKQSESPLPLPTVVIELDVN